MIFFIKIVRTKENVRKIMFNKNCIEKRRYAYDHAYQMGKNVFPDSFVSHKKYRDSFSITFWLSHFN